MKHVEKLVKGALVVAAILVVARRGAPQGKKNMERL
jgi:hypothetical protein